MDVQQVALAAASLNLVAALVGFPVLWDRVNRLREEVAELRRNVRQFELQRPLPLPNPGAPPHAQG